MYSICAHLDALHEQRVKNTAPISIFNIVTETLLKMSPTFYKIMYKHIPEVIAQKCRFQKKACTMPTILFSANKVTFKNFINDKSYYQVHIYIYKFSREFCSEKFIFKQGFIFATLLLLPLFNVLSIILGPTVHLSIAAVSILIF